MRSFFGCLCICTIIALPAYGGQKASEAPSDNDPQINMGVLVGYWTLLGLKGSSSPAIVKDFYKHDSSKTCMPTQVGSFIFKYHKKYGPTDESVTLWSDKLQTQITLYTFPATKSSEEEFETSFTDMHRNCSGKGLITSIEDARFEQPVQIGGCIHHLRQDVTLFEQVVLFRRGGWFHKARISTLDEFLGMAYSPTMDVIQQAFNPCE